MLLFVLAVAPPPTPQRKLLANHTAQTLRLGRARRAFFQAVLAAPGPHGEAIDSGYRSMLMQDHTDMLWPVGRADEVVFEYSGGDPTTVTYWRSMKGVPRRLFHIRVADAGFDLPFTGDLKKYLRAIGPKVDKREANALKSLLQRHRSYATYIESAGAGVFYCRVSRADGSEWPTPNGSLEFAPEQDNQKVDRDGFLITNEELRLMALPKRP